MTLKEAQSTIRELEDKSARYIKEWGQSVAKEAIRTIYDRQGATDEDRLKAERVSLTLCGL